MYMEEIFQELLLSVGISVAVCCMIMKLKPYDDEYGGESTNKSYDGTQKDWFFEEKSSCFYHVNINAIDDGKDFSEMIEDVEVFETLRTRERLSIHEIEESLEDYVDENTLRLNEVEIEDETKRVRDEKAEKESFDEIEEGLYEDEIIESRFEEVSRFSGIDDEQSEDRGEKEEEGMFDDWEGVERTELEKLFGAAMVFVGSKGNAGLIDRDMKIKLYGLHKIAIEGPCRGAQPMALNVSARAKWISWKRLGNMSRELAMEQYLLTLSERVPGWMSSNLQGS